MTRQELNQGGIPEGTADQRAAMRAAGGSEDHTFNACLVGRAAGAAPTEHDPAIKVALAQMTRVAMTAFVPTDAVEGLLVAQAIGLHHATMTCLRRANLPGRTPEGAARSWRDAASLSRAMVETMSALDKYRRRSEAAVPI